MIIIEDRNIILKTLRRNPFYTLNSLICKFRDVFTCTSHTLHKLKAGTKVLHVFSKLDHRTPPDFQKYLGTCVLFRGKYEKRC